MRAVYIVAVLLILGCASTSAKEKKSQCIIDAMKCMSPGDDRPPAYCTALKQYSGSQPGSLGKYEKCYNTKDMQYCVATAKGGPNKCMAGIGECNIGLCVPASCSPTDVDILVVAQLAAMSEQLNKTTLPNPLENLIVADWDTRCEPTEPLPWRWDAYLSASICAILLILAVVETTFRRFIPNLLALRNYRVVDDVGLAAPLLPQTEPAEPFAKGVEGDMVASSTQERQPAPKEVKISKGYWDIVANIEDVFTDAPKGTVTCINGVRTLSMVWVVMGHTADYMPTAPGFDAASVQNILDLMASFWWQAVMAAPYSVDSFFFIGGFLLALITIKKLKKLPKVNFMMIPYMYIHRIWRILPLYAFVVMIFCCLSVHFSSGPLWHIYVDGVNKQKEHWWSNLLFINNFYPQHFKDACMGWTWFLAVDMQLYLVFTPFVFFYFFAPTLTTIILIAMTVISAFLRFGLNLYFDIEYYNQGFGDAEGGVGSKADMHDVTYNKIYARMGPYILGMLVGFLLEKVNRKEDQKATILIWLKTSWMSLISFCVGFSMICFLVFWPQRAHMGDVVWKKDPEVWPTKFGQLWISFNTTWWSVGLALVLWPCMVGKGWLLDKFLSYPLFNPLAKLTYNVYLLHPMLMKIFYASLDKAIHFEVPIFVGWFLLYWLMSNFFALILYAFVEKPVANINIDPVVKTLFCMNKKRRAAPQ